MTESELALVAGFLLGLLAALTLYGASLLI